MQKITVVNTNTQASTSFNSESSNLGQLKAELSQKGMDYSGCTFFEATTKTELTDDASIIPTARDARGVVFMLTKPNKHISSGAGYDRKELYAKVKSLGLAETIKAKFGKNFTMVGSADLAKMVEEAEKGQAAPATKKVPATTEEQPASKTADANADNDAIVKAIMYLAEKAGYTSQVGAILDGNEVTKEEGYSPEELKAMQAYAINRMKK